MTRRGHSIGIQMQNVKVQRDGARAEFADVGGHAKPVVQPGRIHEITVQVYPRQPYAEPVEHLSVGSAGRCITG